MPGAELVSGKGTATPRPAALQERLIRLWASPHGAPKAAIAGAAGLPPSESFGQNPAVLLDRQADAAANPTTTLTWQGGEGRHHVSDPGRSWCDGDGHARQLPARTCRGDSRDEHDGVRLRQISRTGTIRCSRSRRCTPARSSSAERHCRPERESEGDRNRPGVRRHAGSGQRAEGWKVRMVMKASMMMIALACLVAPMAAQGPAPAQQNAAQAPTPRLTNGKPDLSGSWGGGAGPTGSALRDDGAATCSGGARRSRRSTAWSGRIRARTGCSCRPRGSI